MKTLALIAIAGAPLAACSTGNDRTYMGNPDLDGGAVYLDAFKDGARPEVPSTPDAPSLTGIDRSNWTPTVMLAPMDSIAATRTYAVNYEWTSSTPRQQGRMPSPVSSLDISGDSYWTQVREAMASGPLAFIGAVMIIPRMITHSPTREVRYFPEEYWRAPAETARKAGVTTPATASPAETSGAPSQP